MRLIFHSKPKATPTKCLLSGLLHKETILHEFSSLLQIIRVDKIKCIFGVLSRGRVLSWEFSPNPEYSPHVL